MRQRIRAFRLQRRVQDEVRGQHLLQLSPSFPDDATCCRWVRKRCSVPLVAMHLNVSFISPVSFLCLNLVITTSFGKMYACHGGLSPSLETLESIESIDRLVEPEQNADLMDIVWSDPISDEVRKLCDTTYSTWLLFILLFFPLYME